MGRFSRTVGLAALVLVGGQLSAIYAWQRFSARRVPTGQPELVVLDSPTPVRDAFNAAADRQRVLALLSPT